jgi:hypothetical protein
MEDHKINPRGFWETNDGSGHMHDERLMQGLIKLCKTFKLNQAVDFGCGMGTYIKGFRRAKIDSWGYDGNPNTNELTGGLGECLDLSKSFETRFISDLVLSLEVGEHIPEEYEQIFLDNITDPVKDVLVISWAIPGQAGLGHVNCRENSYIIGKLRERGFRYDERWSGILRRSSRLPWFKKTLMVFHREEGKG